MQSRGLIDIYEYAERIKAQKVQEALDIVEEENHKQIKEIEISSQKMDKEDVLKTFSKNEYLFQSNVCRGNQCGSSGAMAKPFNK